MTRLAAPPDLRVATPHEIQRLLPFSHDVSEYRNRSFMDREIVVRYQPSQDSPEGVISNLASATASPPCDSHEKAAPLPPKPPSASYLELTYPFASNQLLRDQYERFETRRIRLGLLLEDLDSLAGDIAARHASYASEKRLVTGFVDKISWLQQGKWGLLALAHDLRLAGEVIWVGRSSMEVLVELSARDPDNGGWESVGEARFVMMARDASMSHAVPVPPLAPSTPQEEALQEQAAARQRQRKLRGEQSLKTKPPTAAEVALLHRIAGQTAARRAKAARAAARGATAAAAADPSGSAAEPPTVAMSKTLVHNTILMHKQDRNNYYKIFGGHLLRLAYEAAFSAAALHCGNFCDAVSMDDVSFLQPVPIGCMLQFEAKVVYVEGQLMRVMVKAVKVEPGNSIVTVTNNFAFAFRSNEATPVPAIIPDTLSEAMEYLEGYRQHMDDVYDGSVAPRL